MLRVPSPPRARRDGTARTQTTAALAGADQGLFEALRARRLELARAQSVPPYVIFHDRTLLELAAARPASEDEMARIPGVGAAKLARYGADFLAVIAAHAE